MAVDQSMDVVLRALQGVFQADDGIKLLLETLARHAMAQEVTRHLGAGDYERTEGRRGHRNGTKPRTLATRVGRVELDVPQVRGCEPYHPSLFAKWQRSERALLVACGEGRAPPFP